MSSYNLKTTLSSYVREQAYLPFRSPMSGWVCRVGSKGLFESLVKKVSYIFFNEGFLGRSFFDFLRKGFSSSSLIIVIRRIVNGLHCFFNRIADYRIRIFFSFSYPLNKRLASSFPVGKIECKISYLVKGWFGEVKKNFLDLFNFLNGRFHDLIIANIEIQNKGKIYSSLQKCKMRGRKQETKNLKLFLKTGGISHEKDY